MVKRYADEDDSGAVRDTGPLVISELSRVEVASAIRRKQRDGDLTPQHADDLLAAFARDIGAGSTLEPSPLTMVRLRADLIGVAVAMLDRWPLRAGDAIQLGTAIVARQHVPDLTVLCFDRQLAEAFRGEGFRVEPGSGLLDP